MIDLSTAIQILALLPPLHFGTPDAAPAALVEGSGVLLISACIPGETVAVDPSGATGVVGEDGTVRIEVPAQSVDAESYLIIATNGKNKVHGTLRKGELLSATCR